MPQLETLIEERQKLYREKGDNIRLINAEFDPKIEALNFQIHGMEDKLNKAHRRAAKNMR